jgi:hypothetical protein
MLGGGESGHCGFARFRGVFARFRGIFIREPPPYNNPYGYQPKQHTLELYFCLSVKKYFGHKGAESRRPVPVFSVAAPHKIRRHGYFEGADVKKVLLLDYGPLQ